MTESMLTDGAIGRFKVEGKELVNRLKKGREMVILRGDAKAKTPVKRIRGFVKTTTGKVVEIRFSSDLRTRLQKMWNGHLALLREVCKHKLTPYRP